jgi:hypothetical protein
MIKFVNILKSVITEAKRYKFTPETLDRMNKVVDKLWDDRKKDYQRRKELIGVIPIKLANGVDGLVRIYVNPRLSYIGLMDIRPSKSLDPADLVIEVNPKYYESKKNLYLTLYHEMIHVSDPTQSVQWSPKYMMTYDEKSDEKYWGHPIEFFAISNEFLEGLVKEFERRINNILNYFSKNEPLNSLSKDILFRVNDEFIGEDTPKQLKNWTADMPNLADFISRGSEEPYYLYYVQMIKKFNPTIWKKFLSMLYDTTFEIKDLIHKK